MGVTVADYIVSKIQEMKKAQAEVMAYCTGECHTCPIEKICDWDYHIDISDMRAEDKEMWERFVGKAQMHDEKQEAKAFKDATSFEPMEWDMLTRGLD